MAMSQLLVVFNKQWPVTSGFFLVKEYAQYRLTA